MLTAPDTISERLYDRWSSEGHDVVTCADGDRGPCRGVRVPGECPLRSPVDLAVLVSTSSSPADLAETGFLCARRHRVPTVAIDPMLAADELWHITGETSAARRRLEAEDALVVQRQLSHDSTAHVRRSTGRVVVTVECDASGLRPKERLVIADAARQAIRVHDPYVNVIDIVVTCPDDVNREEEP